METLVRSILTFAKILAVGLCAFALGMGVAAAQAPAVGQVQQVEGRVLASALSGGVRPLAVGDRVFEGERLSTQANSRLYVTTLDAGFISLRPEASLTLDRFVFDPANPRAAEVRYTLHSGVARVVTGAALEGAKDRFRLNTPLAAIGVRGTDFSVSVTDTATRAVVTEGQIAVSPFVNGCQPSGLGPCSGSSVVDLAAGAPAVVQVLPGDLRPSLLSQLELSPDRIAPPKADEQPQRKAQVSAAAAPAAATTPAVSAVSLTAATPTSAVTTTGVAPVKDELGTAADVSRRVTADPRIHWGRWQAFASLPADQVQALVSANPDARFFLGPFLITRAANGPSRSSSGSFSFSLRDATAYLMNETKGSIEASLVVENPQLTIDFAANRFATSMDLLAPGQRIALRAAGEVTPDGLLYSDYLANATIRGMVSGSDQAGYVFHRPVESGVKSDTKAAVGVTRWVR